MTPSSSDFPVETLLSWYEANGRHDLPWREPDRTSFEFLLAEILLQRTTAAAVSNLYRPFVARYPSPAAVVAAPSGELEAMTAPLGLVTRAEYIERTAGQLLDRHDGEVPSDRTDLLALHGVGEYTAGAVLAHCYGEDCCAVDANVERILDRFFAGDAAGDRTALADALVPPERSSDFLLALLDFGAEVCTARSPSCGACPLSADCAMAGERVPADAG